MTKLAIATIVAATAFLGSAAPAQAATQTVLTPTDVLARPGDAVTLRMKAERQNLIRWDLRGVDIEYLLWDASAQRWNALGRARSGNDGYADLRATAPAAAGDYVVAARVAPGQRYQSSWQRLYLGVRPASHKVVVTDIDWTIAQTEWDKYVGNDSSDIAPVRGALQALRDIGHDASIVYVTARDDYFFNKTRAWLSYWGFPQGALVCSDGLTMFRDPTRYKTEAIAKLKRSFPSVMCGFGNKSTDHAAYVANGIGSYQWDTETTKFPAGTLVYHDFEDLRAAIRRGARPELAWATLYR